MENIQDDNHVRKHIKFQLNMLLNGQWVTKEIRDEIKKFLEFNENGNRTYQNL
jgi:hypothetical protein